MSRNGFAAASDDSPRWSLRISVGAGKLERSAHQSGGCLPTLLTVRREHAMRLRINEFSVPPEPVSARTVRPPRPGPIEEPTLHSISSPYLEAQPGLRQDRGAPVAFAECVLRHRPPAAATSSLTGVVCTYWLRAVAHNSREISSSASAANLVAHSTAALVHPFGGVEWPREEQRLLVYWRHQSTSRRGGHQGGGSASLTWSRQTRSHGKPLGARCQPCLGPAYRIQGH